MKSFLDRFALTCLEEVPLGVILSIIALLWREEEMHSTHLAPHTHQDKQPALKVFASALLSCVVTMRLLHVGNNRLQHLPNLL